MSSQNTVAHGAHKSHEESHTCLKHLCHGMAGRKPHPKLCAGVVLVGCLPRVRPSAGRKAHFGGRLLPRFAQLQVGSWFESRRRSRASSDPVTWAVFGTQTCWMRLRSRQPGSCGKWLRFRAMLSRAHGAGLEALRHHWRRCNQLRRVQQPKAALYGTFASEQLARGGR